MPWANSAPALPDAVHTLRAPCAGHLLSISAAVIILQELFQNLGSGFLTALSPYNFYYCVIGAALGTFVGILPGLGPITTIAMLLPLTFKLPAVTSLIMLSGIYYGAHHSGSTTAVMLNMPGEPTSVVICIDGHPMARKAERARRSARRRSRRSSRAASAYW